MLTLNITPTLILILLLLLAQPWTQKPNYCIRHIIFCDSNFSRLRTLRHFREWLNSRSKRAMNGEVSIRLVVLSRDFSCHSCMAIRFSTCIGLYIPDHVNCYALSWIQFDIVPLSQLTLTLSSFLSLCFALASILALSLCFVLAPILALSLVFRHSLLSSLYILVSRPCFVPASALASRLVFYPCFNPLSSLVFCPRSYRRILSVFRPRLPRKSSCERGRGLCRAAEIGSCFSASQHPRLVACDLTSVLRSLRTRSRASYVRRRTLGQPRCGGLSLSLAVTDSRQLAETAKRPTSRPSRPI